MEREAHAIGIALRPAPNGIMEAGRFPAHRGKVSRRSREAPSPAQDGAVGWEDSVLHGATRQINRLASARRIIGAIDRVGPTYARMAVDSPWLPLPAGVEHFLDQVAQLYGERPAGEERRRLAARRLAFLVTRKVIYLLLQAWPPAQAQSRLPPIDIDGLEHLEAALAGSGGAVLVTAH